MNALVPMSDADLRLALSRSMLRHPEAHPAHELRAACATLLTWGDWIDGQRAQAMLDTLELSELWAAADPRRAAPAVPPDLDYGDEGLIDVAQVTRLSAERTDGAGPAKAAAEPSWSLSAMTETVEAVAGGLALFGLLAGGLFILLGMGALP